MLQQFDRLRDRWWPEMAALIDDVLDAGTPASQLADMTRYHLETGGKRLRAMLPLLVAEQLGADPKDILPFGAACEMLHNATLVHDDLQDGDEVRRGKPAVWRQFGMPQAINAGDAMFYYTLLLARRMDAPEPVRAVLVDRIVRDTLRVIDGQARELALLGTEDATVADYLAVVEGKTSGLFAMPMAGGAVAAGADEETVEQLALAARHLGVLFQIQDDLLDFFGDKGRDKVGNDVREGKRSLMVVHGLRAGTATEAAWLRGVLDKPRERTTDDDVDHVIAYFERVGAFERALDEIASRRTSAVAAVRDPRLRTLVDALCDVLLRPLDAWLAKRASASDVAFCRAMLPKVSRTFALSIEMLPEGLRDPVRVSYLLCRVVDTIEDDATVAPDDRNSLFDAFDRLMADDDADAAEFARASSVLGANDDERALMAGSTAVFKVFRSLSEDQREAVRPWVLEMSRGMRETCARRVSDGAIRVRDLDDLEQYCWYVAGTVGELLTALFRTHAPDGAPEDSVVANAASFGLGLQLVNILKDVAADAERDVCYLPEDLMAAHGVRADQLLDPAHRSASLAVVHALVERARHHLSAASVYTQGWQGQRGREVRLFCAVPLALAWLSLEEVAHGGDALVRGRTPKVTRAVVQRVAATAMQVVQDDVALDAWMRSLADGSWGTEQAA